jgi:putative ABC transport system permease protein
VKRRPEQQVAWGGLLLYARAEWRARWRSLLVIVGLVALTVAAVVATLTGAGRSETAFDRLRTATRASDAIVVPPDTQRNPAAAVASIAAIDGVERATARSELFVRPAGADDLFPDYNLWADAPLEAPTATGLDTPVITTGRAVDPSRAREIVVSEKLAATLGVRVGDTMTLESMTSAWVDLAFNGGDPGPPDGPKVEVEVVGLSRTPADFGRMKGVLHLSPAFVDRYGDQLRAYNGVHVRLSDKALRQMRSGTLRGLDEDIDAGPSPFGDAAATDDGLGTIATALRLVALVAALAGAAVTALALARLTRLALRDRRILAALGWTTREFVEAAVLVFAPWLLVGVAFGLLVGVLATSRALVGLARQIDPTPGSVVVDVRVVVGSALIAVVVALLVVIIAARRGVSVAKRRTRAPLGQVQVRHPLPMVLGVRHALMGETARGGRASRSALVVTAAGLAGAVAALMVGASISRLQSDPLLTGQGEGRAIDSGESVVAYDRALALLEEDDRVEMLAGVHVIFGISSDGSDDLTALAYDVKRGDLGASIVRGRIAQQPDEVAVGPVTLDRLGKHVGETVELRGDAGRADYRIVGVMLFPEGDFKHDEGVALTASGADRLVGDVHDAGSLHVVRFDWAQGVDAHAADKRLAASGLQVGTNENALLPASVSNLGQVESLPRVLAALLVLLSVVTIGHALSVSVRLRAHELGTLRALGMTPRASTGIVATQALTIVGVAVAIGVPVGLVLGAQIWSLLANHAHVVVRAMSPGSVLAKYVLAVAIAAAVLTVVPAWRSFRLRPTDALRAG